MRLPHFFIERPIFASVIAMVVVLVGSIAYFSLPVAEYPNIAPPTIQVTASYPGANAQTVADTVATPLEQEINGVDNMLYMRSQSTGDGRLTLTVTFAPGTDLDAAQVVVQNRIASAEPRLPEAVRRLGVQTRKVSPDMLMVVHLLSPDASRSQLYIANYVYTQVRDVLLRIDGVGGMFINGGNEYAMRVWLDPDKLASLNMVPADVVAALRAQNVQVSGGMLNEPPMDHPGAFQVSVQTTGRLMQPSAFADIIVKSTPDGRVVRLKDVATVELGAFTDNSRAYLDKSPAVALGIMQRPGSNAIETADKVLATLHRLSAGFPPGVSYQVAYNPINFVKKSVDQVYRTIFEASALVVLVVVLFLQNWRAAIIPIVAIPISLIGTFAMMALFGFSLNMLSLFGLVLAIGIVVDDAIVVVENIERNMSRGMSAREAAHKTMDEVGSALVSIALVLSAVFIPTAFVPGVSGQFYRQFALTIAVSTVISMVVSLTLSPALGAAFLRHEPEAANATSRWRHPFRRFAGAFNRGFERIAQRYGVVVARLVRRVGLVGIVYLGLIGLVFLEFHRVPGGFLPTTDKGFLIASIQLPPGAQLSRTDQVVRREIRLLLARPEISHIASYAGWSVLSGANEPNMGTMFMMMPDFDRRPPGMTAATAQRAVERTLQQVRGAFNVVIRPTPVRGVGNGGFRLMVQDRDGVGLRALHAAVQKLVGAANQDPAIARAFSAFSLDTPQLFVDIDRTRARMLDVPIENIHGALENYIGSNAVNDFNFLGRAYRVVLQGGSQWRRTADDIARLKVRSERGAMVPLGTLATFRDISGPFRLQHYDVYPAAAIDGQAAPGVSSGQALAAMEHLAAKTLPAGIGYEWTDIAYQEKQIGHTAGWLFALAVVFVFLVLAAQYESWTLPLSIILIVPMCLLFALFGLDVAGLQNNILAQVGFVVLIGLASKNAILIVEFARTLEDRGERRLDAVVHAAGLRLRPIVMTSMAFILGVVPLVASTGAGAEMRRSLGTAVFSGMIGVTLFGLLLTPVFYVICRRIGRARRRS